MFHYQKNIGDYRSATIHFSLLEHGVYNQMLDWYYLDETPLPLDNRTLFRRLSAVSEDEQKAVINVLEMFQKTESGWVHKRVEREIAQFKAKSHQAREAGKLGGRPLKKGIGFENNRDGFENKADAKPTANREPLTVNQEPLKTQPFAPNEKISFDAQRGLQNIKPVDLQSWGKAYPALNIKTEIAKVEVWLRANPKNLKSNYERFIANWFSKAQDKAPRVNANAFVSNYRTDPMSGAI